MIYVTKQIDTIVIIPDITIPPPIYFFKYGQKKIILHNQSYKIIYRITAR